MVVELASSAGDSAGLLVGVEGESGGSAQATGEGCVDVVVCCVAGDMRDDRVDGFQRMSTRAG